MKTLLIMVPATMVLFAACSKTETAAQPDPKANQALTPTQQGLSASTPNTVSGIKTLMSAYYDSTLFNIMFVEFSPAAEASLIAHNKSLNLIYQSDNGLPNNRPFISVINAIQGDGFNPVWREVQIVFNPGFTPRQLYSDNAVLAAASGTHPEITLTVTNEVYWCPVIGPK